MKLKPVTVYPVKCLRCTFEWYPVVDSPKMCPRCKSPNWQSKKKTPKWAMEADK